MDISQCFRQTRTRPFSHTKKNQRKKELRLKEIQKIKNKTDLITYVDKRFREDREDVYEQIRKSSDQTLDIVWKKIESKSPQFAKIGTGKTPREAMNYLVSDDFLTDLKATISLEIDQQGIDSVKRNLIATSGCIEGNCKSADRKVAGNVLDTQTGLGKHLTSHEIYAILPCILLLPLCVLAIMFGGA